MQHILPNVVAIVLIRNQLRLTMQKYFLKRWILIEYRDFNVMMALGLYGPLSFVGFYKGIYLCALINTKLI